MNPGPPMAFPVPLQHDKAAQERVDEFRSNTRFVMVARLRPALKSRPARHQKSSATFSEWFRCSCYVPDDTDSISKEARAQVVHTDDVARAYVLAALTGAEGAFNICADDILTPQIIGGVLTGNPKYGRVLPIPSKALRPLVKAAHRSGLLAADEGWLDMAVHSPLMDNTRAKQELGWEPLKTAAQALDELIEGMAVGEGRRSAPMRPRQQRSVAPFVLPPKGHRLPDDIDAMALRQYMADHLAGATAGRGRMARLAKAFANTPMYGEIASVADEVRLEHKYLQKLMNRQGFPRPGISAPALWVGERVARVKSYFPKELKNAPSVLVLETELMLSAVTSKLHGWKTLLNNTAALGVPASVLNSLSRITERQYEKLQKAHQYARVRAFKKSYESQDHPLDKG